MHRKLHDKMTESIDNLVMTVDTCYILQYVLQPTPTYCGMWQVSSHDHSRRSMSCIQSKDTSGKSDFATAVHVRVVDWSMLQVEI